MLGLLAEEIVAGGTETFKDFRVHLLGGATNLLPLLLDLDDALRYLFPFRVILQVGRFYVFYFFTESRLLGQIFLFFGFQGFEILSVTLVYC